MKGMLRSALLGVAIVLPLLGVLQSFSPARAWASTPASLQASPTPASNGAPGSPVPILAYYYMWYDSSSWNAKIDYPLLGRYTSGNVSVMRQQIALAKRAGISGFLVGWKADPTLNSRLARLVKVARAAHFKLGLVFQSLDFSRNPLPMAEVNASFSYFVARYGRDPVFDIFGKPLVIWSGTWMYTSSQLASITRPYGSQLTILASEKHPSSYQAIAGLFKGDAYYWSSVDPLATPGYQGKLNDFAVTVHRHGGVWIAPAAPGYDATLIGGRRVVPRRGGQTLRLEMNAALASSPDAIGLISWNEFSENTYVEPSRHYGDTSLRVLAGIKDTAAPGLPGFDSSGPAGFHPGAGQLLILGAIVILFGGSVAAIGLRGVRGRQ